MSNLAALVGDVFDCLSECVNGPVRGAVSAAASAGTVIVPRGQLGTLPDGRVVRCTKATKVPTTGASVPVRLQFLSPSYPVASNFSAVAGGLRVTWISPPAGLVATGTTAAPFAPFVAGAPLVSVAELEHLAANVDPFAAGAQGGTLAVLLSPTLKALPGGERMLRRTHAEVAFKLRCNLSTFAPHGAKRASARDTFDSIAASLGGAGVAGSLLQIGGWQLAKQDGANASYELACSVQVWMRGRVQQTAHLPSQPFTTLGTTTHINPTGQTPDEAIADDIAIPPA